MAEIRLNLHIHTKYSDGARTHANIAQIALKTGLDAIITTDHNVFVEGVDQYYQDGSHKLLIMAGEEVHNPLRLPQKSHVLVIGAGIEMTPFNNDPQQLIDQIRKENGLSFLAHPHEEALPAFGETAINWDDWQVSGFTGIEIWNGLSEFKTVFHNILHGLLLAYVPAFLPHGPNQKTMRKWDEYTSQGKHIVGIAGSDAHELSVHLGPLHTKLYPYEFHFRSITNHLVTPTPLSGNLMQDREMILNALRNGHLFIANDMIHPAKGFEFIALGKGIRAGMGDEIALLGGVTFQIRAPIKTRCQLFLNGKNIKTWRNHDLITYTTNQAGVYRLECSLPYLGKERTWIISNPIYLVSGSKADDYQ
jgi:hypothetical protein